MVASSSGNQIYLQINDEILSQEKTVVIIISIICIIKDSNFVYSCMRPSWDFADLSGNQFDLEAPLHVTTGDPREARAYHCHLAHWEASWTGRARVRMSYTHEPVLLPFVNVERRGTSVTLPVSNYSHVDFCLEGEATQVVATQEPTRWVCASWDKNYHCRKWVPKKTCRWLSKPFSSHNPTLNKLELHRAHTPRARLLDWSVGEW